MQVYVEHAGSILGPIPLHELPAAVAKNGISLEQKGWHDGLSTWVPLKSIPQVAATLAPTVSNKHAWIENQWVGDTGIAAIGVIVALIGESFGGLYIWLQGLSPKTTEFWNLLYGFTWTGHIGSMFILTMASPENHRWVRLFGIASGIWLAGWTGWFTYGTVIPVGMSIIPLVVEVAIAGGLATIVTWFRKRVAKPS